MYQYIFVFTFFFLACTKAAKQPTTNTTKVLTIQDTVSLYLDSLMTKGTPMMGYRFVVIGDFDGNQRPDTLVENYKDSLGLQEVPKSYSNFGYEDMTEYHSRNAHQSFMADAHKKLVLGSGLLAFHYVENCGDLNLDGRDELLVVFQWADYSNTNTAYIYSWQQNEWKELWNFPIWEWQFPTTPSVTMLPSSFGKFTTGAILDDSTNVALEKYLQNFRFIKHLKGNYIELECRNPFEDAVVESASIDEEYVQKNFRRIMMQDSTYLQARKQPAFYYKAEVISPDNKEKILILPIDDPAASFVVRINLKDSTSPFLRK